MSVDLVATERLGNLNDPSYELLLRRELGGVFEVDELLLDWDQADARLFVGVTELGRTVNARLDATDGERLADGDVLAHMTQSAVKSHNGPADRLQSVGGACR